MQHFSLFLGKPLIAHILGSSDQIQVQFPVLILTIFSYGETASFVPPLTRNSRHGINICNFNTERSLLQGN